MRVVHINVRGTQGGAGRSAYDLHRRLTDRGHESTYLYGYASGITDDASLADDAAAHRLGTKASVRGNYLAHWALGQDVFASGRRVTSSAIESADVVHIHAVHHYFTSYPWLFGSLVSRRKPTVLTAHDWWFVTGRCASPGDCSGWRGSCGVCGSRRFGDLPSAFDISSPHRRRKRSLMTALLTRGTLATPSKVLFDDMREAYPGASVRLVRNGIDLEFESALDRAASAGSSSRRTRVLVCAADLTDPRKVNADLLARIASHDSVELILAGKGEIVSGDNVTNLGPVVDRQALAELYASSHLLLFTSEIDSFGLVIAEALCSGTPVVSLAYPAPTELLGLVGGAVVRSPQEAEEIIAQRRWWDLYSTKTRDELAHLGKQAFAGRRVLQEYLEAYEAVLERE